MNFRADRARQLSQSLIEPEFSGFARRMVPNINLVTTTEYASTLTCPVAFPPDTLEDSLGEVLAESGLTQLRIAETEKYAHVTFSSAVDANAFPGKHAPSSRHQTSQPMTCNQR